MLKLLRDHRVRFAATGAAMTLLHLAIFQVLSPHVLPEVANAAAFALATQVNFLLSYHWTWADRRAASREPLGRLLRRALLFNASVLIAFGANSLAFWALHRLAGLPPQASVLAATVVSAGVSYLVSSRLVFARAVRAQPVVPVPAVPMAAPAALSGPVPVPVGAALLDR